MLPQQDRRADAAHRGGRARGARDGQPAAGRRQPRADRRPPAQSERGRRREGGPREQGLRRQRDEERSGRRRRGPEANRSGGGTRRVPPLGRETHRRGDHRRQQREDRDERSPPGARGAEENAGREPDRDRTAHARERSVAAARLLLREQDERRTGGHTAARAEQHACAECGGGTFCQRQRRDPHRGDRQPGRQQAARRDVAQQRRGRQNHGAVGKRASREQPAVGRRPEAEIGRDEPARQARGSRSRVPRATPVRIRRRRAGVTCSPASSARATSPWRRRGTARAATVSSRRRSTSTRCARPRISGWHVIVVWRPSRHAASSSVRQVSSSPRASVVCAKCGASSSAQSTGSSTSRRPPASTRYGRSSPIRLESNAKPTSASTASVQLVSSQAGAR